MIDIFILILAMVVGFIVGRITAKKPDGRYDQYIDKKTGLMTARKRK